MAIRTHLSGWKVRNGARNGKLLILSYGYGKVFVVPFEKIGYQVQGGVFELPIPRFSTGVMRGRFNPRDGQLYLAGLSAWGSTQPQLGGGDCIESERQIS